MNTYPPTTLTEAPNQCLYALPSLNINVEPTVDLRAQLTAIWRDARPVLAPPWLPLPHADSLPLCVQESAATAYQSHRPLIQAYTLGETTVRCNGKVIEESLWHTTKNKYLLFCLLSHPNGVSEDAILEEFWPNNWDTGKQNLYAATSKLRHLFRSLSDSEQRFIVRRHGRLMWENNLPLWYDLLEVRRQAQNLPSATQQLSTIPPQGTATHQSTAALQDTASLAAHQRLVELIHGPFLPECEHSWAQAVRAEIDLLLQKSLITLSRHFLALGQGQEALEYAQRLAHQFPLEQQGCELVMLALLSLGHSTRALECYRTFCAGLRRELNAEPTVELLALYQRAKMGVMI